MISRSKKLVLLARSSKPVNNTDGPSVTRSEQKKTDLPLPNWKDCEPVNSINPDIFVTSFSDPKSPSFLTVSEVMQEMETQDTEIPKDVRPRTSVNDKFKISSVDQSSSSSSSSTTDSSDDNDSDNDAVGNDFNQPQSKKRDSLITPIPLEQDFPHRNSPSIIAGNKDLEPQNVDITGSDCSGTNIGDNSKPPRIAYSSSSSSSSSSSTTDSDDESSNDASSIDTNQTPSRNKDYTNLMETIVTPSEVDLPYQHSPSILAANEDPEPLNVDFPGGDFSGTDSGDEFKPSSTSESSDNNSSDNDAVVQPQEPASKKRGRKRTRNPTNWKKNIVKRLKNSGQGYVSLKSKKEVQPKKMGPPCSMKCRLSCASKYTEEKRTELFQSYWNLGSLQRQRDFLNSCIRPLKCAYRRKKTNKQFERKPNTAYYLLNGNKDIRVCKTFLTNTLGITQRIIRTVINAQSENAGFIPEDLRGKHGKQCKLSPELIQAVKDHINSIPKVESHYLRANTSRMFIDGGLTVSELHRNYAALQTEQNKPVVNYDAYSRIFNQDFNIGFFKPKKDRCDECEAFDNTPQEEKHKLKASYKLHLEEKSLSRIEKERDMKQCREPESTTVVITYDLQAVLSCPVGNSSAFFYKSRLNCYDFTMSNAKDQETTCFFWHEGLGNRGAIEIGSCVYAYLEQVSLKSPGSDVIFYSDNCCGQQKNRFMFAMYYYAVKTLNINSIKHSFLIRGHTQNEGDAAHSVIEKAIIRAKKSGPIYVPEQYISIIRGAKKTGKPFVVKEMNYDNFYDLKSLEQNLNFNMAKNVDGNVIKISEIKSIKFTNNSDTYLYRTTFKTENWNEAKCVTQTRGKTLRGNRGDVQNISDISLKPAYTSKIAIKEHKKRDLLQLVETNIVPRYYEKFYKDLI